MINRFVIAAIFPAMVMSFLSVGERVFAGDLDDGISKYTDESISADDQALKADTNINFIVLKAQAQAQMRKKAGDKNANFNDGSGDQNENSVIVGPGTQTGDIYNIIVEK